MTHPIIQLEDQLITYLKQMVGAAARWLLEHKPTRTSFQALMFNRPRADADAQLFTFNGVSFGTRFYGSVRSQAAVVAPAAPPAKIVTP